MTLIATAIRRNMPAKRAPPPPPAVYQWRAKGDWVSLIEPFREGAPPELSGSGPCVTDLFPRPAATIAHADATSLEGVRAASLYLSLGRRHDSMEAWAEDTVLGDSLFSAPFRLQGYAIVRPTGDRTQDYWMIDVPIGTERHIARKQTKARSPLAGNGPEL